MAYIFSYSDPAGPALNQNWPEERLLTHLLRTAASSTPEVFKSLHGSHPVDLYQSNDAFELRTDAPGLSQDDIIVEVHEDVLKIAAKSPAGAEGAAHDKPPESAAAPEAHWKLLRRERTTTHNWVRAFLLPDNADAERISVKLDRGTLTVHVPMCPPPPKSLPRRIQVNSN